MMLGARAGIRNGKDTSFWSARWLDSGAILANFADDSDPDFNPSDSVADFVTDGDKWDFDKLNKLLPHEIVEQIIGMSAPKEEHGEDIWTWGGSHDGRFSIKSAYDIVVEENALATDSRWSKLWNWRGPHRIKLFLWLVYHERLLTNAERVRRHLSPDASCNRCGFMTESVNHVLRDCPIASETWLRLGFAQNSAMWQDTSVSWILDGLCSERSLLFGITVWILWKARNECLFANVSMSPLQIEARIRTWTSHVFEAMKREIKFSGPTRTKCWKQIAWEPGPNEWITLGCCTVTRAELRGAITGLELAWSYGFRNIDLQLDSRVATAILTCADDPIHQYATEVLSFRELCNREWRVEIRHVYREANKVADFLANQGHLFPFGTHLFPLSDCNLGHILRYDCLGISEPRFILIDN
ncbi:Putative ribonuclease H protein At1g65750 [Linum perenne]